jgi:DNA-binding transcriptional LysR family regulator
MMDLRRLRTYVTVATLGSVSKAAQSLGITQPALSRQIGELQRELGIKLFDRVGRTLALTPEGEQLLGECRSLLDHAQAIGERVKAIGSSNSGVLRLAVASLVTETIAPLLHRYAQNHPAVEVKLFEAVGAEVLNLLWRGEIHLGVCLLRSVQTDGRDFATQPLQPVELVAACQPTFPLKKGKKVRIQDVVEHPLLLFASTFSVRMTFDAVCRMSQLTPDVMLESNAPSNLLALAEGGHGVAVITSLVQTYRYRLRKAPITLDGKPLREPFVIVWDKRRTLPSYANEFSAMLAMHMRQVLPIPRLKTIHHPR